MSLGKDGERNVGVLPERRERREEEYVEETIWKNERPDCAYPFENDGERMLKLGVVVIIIIVWVA